jgi:hypothetical protein
MSVSVRCPPRIHEFNNILERNSSSDFDLLVRMKWKTTGREKCVTSPKMKSKNFWRIIIQEDKNRQIHSFEKCTTGKYLEAVNLLDLLTESMKRQEDRFHVTIRKHLFRKKCIAIILYLQTQLSWTSVKGESQSSWRTAVEPSKCKRHFNLRGNCFVRQFMPNSWFFQYFSDVRPAFSSRVVVEQPLSKGLCTKNWRKLHVRVLQREVD